MKITVGSATRVSGCSQQVASAIEDRLTFPNPKYLETQRLGYSTYSINQQIQCLRYEGSTLVIPRGFTSQAAQIGTQYGEKMEYVDERPVLPDVEFQFTGCLRPFQFTAVNAMLQKPFGVLQSPTGSGKTVAALALIAERKQPALIVVHTKELLNQWIDRIETFLSIPKVEIGIIGAGKMRVGNRVTVALVQSLVKCVEDAHEYVGNLIVDECHRCPSKTFLDVVTAFDCLYMTGLSATPYRRDGLTRLIYFYLGEKQYEVPAAQMVDEGRICRAVVKTVDTAFSSLVDGSAEYSKLLSELTQDECRNELISSTVAGSESTGLTLVLSDRKTHCTTLQAMLRDDHGINAEVLTGDMSEKARTAMVDRLRSGGIKTLCATGQLIGEGFDLPQIETVVLATPVKFSGRLIQYIGRALRPANGKDHAIIIDFTDRLVGVLAAGANARRRVFKNMPGIDVL